MAIRKKEAHYIDIDYSISVLISMKQKDFLQLLDADTCPRGLSSPLQALWHDRQGDWDRAHRIVQQLDDRLAARIHAYLHREEGDDGNARYWHARAGSRFPLDQSLEEEWRALVEEACE